MSSGAPTLGGIRRLATVTVRDLNVTGTLTTTGGISDGSSITLADGKALQSDTTTGHTATLSAYDVDGAAYKAFATLTNGNTPSFAIAAPSGGTVTIDGAVIGGTTPLAATFTTISATDDVTVGNGKAIKTDTTTAHTAVLQAYDVDGTAYKTFATLTNGNTPSLAIAAPAGGTVAIDGAVIGGVTPAAVTGTTIIGTSASVTGALTARSGTATPAAASAVAAVLFSSTSGLGIYWGSGSPNTALTAAKGSLYLATDGSSSSTRAFVNTDASTGWTAVTTAT